MALIFTAKHANSRTALKAAQHYQVTAKVGEEYNLIDSVTGKTPEDIKVARRGNDLILRSDKEDVEVVIKDFWGVCSEDNQCYAKLDVPATETTPAGEVIITQVDHELEGLIAGEVGTIEDDRGGMLFWWILGGIGAAGAIAAGSGGGSGGGSSSNNSHPSDYDSDHDGVNDADERAAGLDPHNPDTNGDGILDGDEDSDGDGIPNKDESNPNGTVFTDKNKDGVPDLIQPNDPTVTKTQTKGREDGGIKIDPHGGNPDTHIDKTILTYTPEDGNDGKGEETTITFENIGGADGKDNWVAKDKDGKVLTPDELKDKGITLNTETGEVTLKPDAVADNTKVSVQNQNNAEGSKPSKTIEVVAPADDHDGDGIPDSEDPDSDNDGVPDEIEKNGGLDPHNPDTNGDGVEDGKEDSDGDGKDNETEVKDNTDPFKNEEDPSLVVDQDGDGIRDDVDTDIDGDGVNNADEKAAGTDPRNPATDGTPDGDKDTDNDGLTNKEESNPNGSTVTGRDGNGKPDITDPKGNDADNDGVSNKDEKDKGTNPNSPDTDGDGKVDGKDDNNAYDKDGDGINDADEKETGTNPENKDPENTDSDGDGVSDKDESDTTQPGITDKDGDGVSDLTQPPKPEVKNATKEGDDGKTRYTGGVEIDPYGNFDSNAGTPHVDKVEVTFQPEIDDNTASDPITMTFENVADKGQPDRWVAKDDSGNVIPADKLADKGIKLDTETGKITFAPDAVADGTKVTAQNFTDAAKNPSAPATV
ncbi:hypothetical protein, partial [Gallibacterium anatis]|uniref:hypothetical protein n=1 Tax=Gallibacterium anatis TaxID=750 RepID=UPI00053169FD